MGDSSRSPTTEHHGIFANPLKDISKAYKYFKGKKHHDKKNNNNSPSKESPDESFNKNVNGKETEDDKFISNDDEQEQFNPGRSMDDSIVTKSTSSTPFFSKAASRRSHTPSARPTYLSKSESKKTTTNNISHSQSMKSSMTFLLRSFSRKHTSEAEISISAPSMCVRGNEAITAMGMARDDVTDQIKATSLSRSMSKRSTTPILFTHSQTNTRKKPSPIEMKLECTLEELCQGEIKKIKITKDVIKDPGIIVQEQEILRIKLKPGWRKGTKITFEGKGDEKPGYLPADIIFSIDEKKHPLFKRKGNDLEIAAELPLVNALCGCSLPVPLLGGETMNITLHEIVYNGYEKIIKGQGMPVPKEEGKRGDLKITFLVIFPNELSDEQKSEVCRVLHEDCF